VGRAKPNKVSREYRQKKLEFLGAVIGVISGVIGLVAAIVGLPDGVANAMGRDHASKKTELEIREKRTQLATAAPHLDVSYLFLSTDLAQMYLEEDPPTSKEARTLLSFPTVRNEILEHEMLAGLPWRQIPVMDRTRDHGHGRIELRTLKVAAVAGLCFPHAAQAIQVIRRVRAPGNRRWRTVTAYAVTSLALGTASPAQLAGWLHGHWRIENRLHWVRDVTFGEDAPPHAPAASPG
jgi:hypothetical protein